MPQVDYPLKGFPPPAFISYKAMPSAMRDHQPIEAPVQLLRIGLKKRNNHSHTLVSRGVFWRAKVGRSRTRGVGVEHLGGNNANASPLPKRLRVRVCKVRFASGQQLVAT
jgi:hypothetical protein